MKSFKSYLMEMAFKKGELSTTETQDIGSSHDVRKYKDTKGTTYFVKTPSVHLYDAYNDSVLHILVEYLAYELYHNFNIKVPYADLYIKDDQIMLASQQSHGTHVDFAQLTNYKDFVKGFAVDIFIANWDTAGTGDFAGNLIVDNKGNVTRIDPGGSLTFRARGGRKGERFAKQVGEYDSMRDEEMSQVAKSYNTHEDMIKESFHNFFTVAWSTLQSKLTRFNQINIIEPIEELIENSELKLDILEEWDDMFDEIINKLEHRYGDMKRIYNEMS